jgi:hypothetical protein
VHRQCAGCAPPTQYEGFTFHKGEDAPGGDIYSPCDGFFNSLDAAAEGCRQRDECVAFNTVFCLKTGPLPVLRDWTDGACGAGIYMQNERMCKHAAVTMRYHKQCTAGVFTCKHLPFEDSRDIEALHQMLASIRCCTGHSCSPGYPMTATHTTIRFLSDSYLGSRMCLKHQLQHKQGSSQTSPSPQWPPPHLRKHVCTQCVPQH